MIKINDDFHIGPAKYNLHNYLKDEPTLKHTTCHETDSRYSYIVNYPQPSRTVISCRTCGTKAPTEVVSKAKLLGIKFK